MSSLTAPAVADILHAAKSRPVARDPLTGFRTQDYFIKRLDRLIERRAWRHKPLTLGLLQLANFYEISAWIGNSDARLLLNDLARLLEKVVPANTRLCRCHNLEFAVLLIDEGSRKVSAIAEAIHQTLQTEGAGLVPPQLRLVCGLGLVRIGPETPSAEIAFARARHAIGRNQANSVGGLEPGVELQDPGLPARLAQALASHRFELSFQAIVSFREDGRQRYELRVTLPRDNGQPPLPARNFMDIAVRHALGEQLDRQVLSQAVKLLQHDREAHSELVVNLSQNSLISREFASWLACSVPPALTKRLILQISEIDALIAQHHLVTLRECSRTTGLVICIARFGMTDNPLRYLPLIEPGMVKMDAAMLNGLRVDAGRRELLANLVSCVHERGIRVVMPKVEDYADLPILWRAGVDLVQGNCLHAPSRRRDFEFVEDIELSTSQEAGGRNATNITGEAPI